MSDPNASYQPAQPYQGGTAPQSTKTNLFAILALVGAFVFPLAGLILGIIALKQVKETGEQGRGLALAGVIISAVYMVVAVIIIIASFALAASVGTSVSY